MLERVLDKGVVIVGDIVVSVLDVELLTLKLRLFIASADTAREMGLDWWTADPFYNSNARALRDENASLRERLAALEDRAAGPGLPDTSRTARGHALESTTPERTSTGRAPTGRASGGPIASEPAGDGRADGAAPWPWEPARPAPALGDDPYEPASRAAAWSRRRP